MGKITKETRIGAMMKKYPETVQVLKKYNLDCFGCAGADQDRINHIAISYGIEIERLLEDLNSAA